MIRALKEEIKMSLEISWQYKSNFISEIAIMSILLIGLLLTNSGSGLSQIYNSPGGSKSLLLIGYLMWYISTGCVNSLSELIRSESTQGTLEHKFMSSTSKSILFLGNLLGSLIITLGTALIITLIATIFFNVKIFFDIRIIPIILLNFIGMYGIGLIFGGIALKEKKVGSILYIFQIILIFISDTIIIMNGFSARNLIPLTVANDLVRKILGGEMINLKLYLFFILLNVIWLIVGLLVFKYFYNKSREKGWIYQY